MAISKSKRLNLIRDISTRMSDDEWSYIDLILSTFECPTQEIWSGDKESYVIKMIGNIADNTLLEMATHFGIEPPSLPDALSSVEPSTYWIDGTIRIFISHMSAHKAEAADIKRSLERYPFSCFVAHNDISPTKEWLIEIETALQSGHVLLALMHEGFKDSSWCDQEIGFALGRGIPVLAVCFDCDPHGFVSKFQAFKGMHKNPASLSRELFEAIISNKKMQDKAPEIIINHFINSGSYASAKERVEYLDKIQTWDESYEKRLKDAIINNSQIKNSWGVSQRANELIAKLKKKSLTPPA